MSEVKRFSAGDVFEGAEVVYADDFDRVTAERDAALLGVDRLSGTIEKLYEEILDRNQRLSAAPERADVLEWLLRKVSASCALAWANHQPTADTLELQELIDAALKPAEGGGDA